MYIFPMISRNIINICSAYFQNIEYVILHINKYILNGHEDTSFLKLFFQTSKLFSLGHTPMNKCFCIEIWVNYLEFLLVLSFISLLIFPKLFLLFSPLLFSIFPYSSSSQTHIRLSLSLSPQLPLSTLPQFCINFPSSRTKSVRNLFLFMLFLIIIIFLIFISP